MDTGVEGIGEAVTGGLAARAVEPHGGRHGVGGDHEREAACLNCGTELVGEFCHACGQHGHVHRSLAAFGHDLLHGVLHFEGKFWRTLPMLAWHPGQLTRRYAAGERARFVSPLALFLFSVFLMFAVISTMGGPFAIRDGTSREDRKTEEAEFRQGQQQARAKLEALKTERAGLAPGTTAEIDERIAAAERELKLAETIFEGAMAATGGAEAQARTEVGDAQKGAADAAKPDSGPELDFVDVPPALGWLETAYRKAKENPSLLFYKVQSNAYKFSWALIPISVPFLWLLFLHRRRYRERFHAYDHVVFVTYSIAFMSLGFVLLTLLRPLPSSAAIAGLAIVFVPPIHIYRQLRGAYSLSAPSAVWRTFVLLNFTFIAAGIFMSLLLVLGLLG